MQNNNFNLERFISAQENIYNDVLSELKNGKKESHWIWFIFPQINGLASSETAMFYSIKSIEEARDYFKYPILNQRLIECSEILYNHQGLSISDILGFPDDLKFKSSMTLFAYISYKNSIFDKNINKYFSGEIDLNTIRILKE